MENVKKWRVRPRCLSQRPHCRVVVITTKFSHFGWELFLSILVSVYFSVFSVFQTFSKIFSLLRGKSGQFVQFSAQFRITFQFISVCFSFFQCAFLVCFQGSPLKIAETLKKTEKDWIGLKKTDRNFACQFSSNILHFSVEKLLRRPVNFNQVSIC